LIFHLFLLSNHFISGNTGAIQDQFEPEVLDIHLPQTARRPKITAVAALSAANGMNFVRFTPSCAIVRVTQGWGLDV